MSRKEGVLHLTRDDVSKRIYFRDGLVIFAGSDEEHDRLGEVLVRAGRIQRSDLELALKVLKETGESLGKTVADMGLASPADIELHAEMRTKSIIASVFSWPTGTFYFEEKPGGVRHEMSRELPVHEVILESVRALADPEIVRRGVGDLRAVLRQPGNPLVPYGEGSLSSSVEWLLYQANGVSTIAEIVAGSPLDEDKTLQSIYGLVLAGILEIESPERALAARMESTKVSIGREESRLPPSAAKSPGGQGEPTPAMLGRYEVERLLGRGAMGAVYVARDPAIDRKVAIKLIQTAIYLSPTELEKYRERFYREAKAAGKLLHPGIVTVFDVGHTADATPFIVMEYVEGRTLGEIVKAGKLELEEILRLSREILDALSFAHTKGVVHRDIKPANVLVTEDGRAKIMDFGIAHVVGSDLTQADDVLGSPNYMAPEQLSKGVIDPRADVFAFGVVLYRMLTGVLPFQGDSFASIAKAVLFEEPPAPAVVDPSIPVGVSDAVVRCIAKDPAQRFASAAELKQALESPHQPGARAPSTAPPTTRRPRRAWTLGAAAGVAAAIVAVLVVSWPEREPSSATNEENAVAIAPPDPTAASLEVEETPPEEDPAPEAPQASEAELYHEASIALERGELEASRRALESLLQRNPGFEGAPELLVRVNERIRARSTPRPAESASASQPPQSPPSNAPAPASREGQLFYEARLAFDNGEFQESKGKLETLLRTNPSFEGATELLVKVNDEIWAKSLPLSYQARHNHRIGGCTGTLSLGSWGIRFSSSDHDWSWKFEQIRVMQRVSPRTVNLETDESEVLALGKSKSYRFELTRSSIRDEDWARFERLAP